MIRMILRRRRLWFDDAWAFFSALALLVQIGAVYTVTDKERPGIARYYLIATGFYTIIWSARLSLLFSIIRIDPSPQRRRFLYLMALLYIVMYIFLVCQLLWICQREGPWKLLATPQCHLTVPVGVAQLTTDVVADGSLLIMPIMLFRMLEDRRLRRRLMGIFSTCIVTTIVSLVHGVYLLTSTGLPVLIAGITEDCVSLVVCNITVIATAMLRRGQDSPTRQRQQHTFVLSTFVFESSDQETTINDQGTLPVDGKSERGSSKL